MIEVRKTVAEAMRGPYGMRRGDLLLYKGSPGTFGRLIRIASRSQYSHAGIVDFRANNGCGSIPILIDVTCRGGRDIDLEEEVAVYPGAYDLYRANPYGRWKDFSRSTACQRMMKFRGTEYGWGSIFKASLAFLPGIRFFQRYETFNVPDERTDKIPPFCSMACSIAYASGGVDPVANRKHSETTPGDLANSLFFSYTCTLV